MNLSIISLQKKEEKRRLQNSLSPHLCLLEQSIFLLLSGFSRFSWICRKPFSSSSHPCSFPSPCAARLPNKEFQQSYRNQYEIHLCSRVPWCAARRGGAQGAQHLQNHPTSSFPSGNLPLDAASAGTGLQHTAAIPLQIILFCQKSPGQSGTAPGRWAGANAGAWQGLLRVLYFFFPLPDVLLGDFSSLWNGMQKA